jgi:hypothetical protein
VVLLVVPVLFAGLVFLFDNCSFFLPLIKKRNASIAAMMMYFMYELISSIYLSKNNEK